jgi:hypothetical protein
MIILIIKINFQININTRIVNVRMKRKTKFIQNILQIQIQMQIIDELVSVLIK